MFSIRRALPTLMVCALLTSCASSEKLTRRSVDELRAGQPDRAYQTAIIALKKQPTNTAALAALEDAARALESSAEHRVHALAAADTMAAAHELLQLYEFRLDVARHGGQLLIDPAFTADERTIRMAAAGRQYADGDQEMRDGRPKSAYRRFVAAHDFWPGYRDVDARIQKSLAEASARLAVVGFEDDSDLPGLADEVRRRVAGEVERRVRPDQLTFTEYIPLSEVDRRMTVSEQRHLTRQAAISIGRRIGARRVVWGHISSPHIETNNDRYEGTIYRREQVRDTSGRMVDRYVEVPITAVRRDRQVSVRVVTEIIDVENEAALTNRDETHEAEARTVYTSYQPVGECNRYSLVPPALREQDSARAREMENGWQATFGSWSVSGFLECARSNHSRRSYQHDQRSAFLSNTRNQPYFLDDLPNEADMTLVALDGLWQGVVSQVREQDEE
jgi:hypothetical protein